MTARRLYITVALCAVVVYLGALWNKFALDDLPIIVVNPLVTQPSGLWRAFAAPYWTPELGGHMYRPLVIAGFALDALVDGTLWFHAVNLLWHAGAAVAVAALALYVVFTLAGLAGFGFTLTLPGLAGLALSVGIAVDANVLIFERIREELVHGKSLRLAVDDGFLHAMNAIVDSNVSTILTALILYAVGTGPVQGFAITLIIGIIASMISAIFVVKTLFLIWLQRRPDLVTLSI